MLVAGHGLVDGKAAQLEFGGAANGIGGDDVAGEIANHQAQRIALNADIERGGAEADGCGVLRRGCTSTDLLRGPGRTAHEASSGNLLPGACARG